MSRNQDIETVRKYYDSSPETEWNRFEAHPFEYRITKQYVDRYLKPGDKVLDIGGGPGRYSLYLAEKGCDVTLFDLSEGNVRFALQKAKEAGLPLKGICGDARFADALCGETYDAVLLMGPLYHLLEAEDRSLAVQKAVQLLKSDGVFFASFISVNAGIYFAMKYLPEALLDETERDYLDCYKENRTFCGNGFTKAAMLSTEDVRQLLSQFALTQLHLLGQESILAPCEETLLAQPQAVIDQWLEMALAVCEREDLLSLTEHLLYIGRKTE